MARRFTTTDHLVDLLELVDEGQPLRIRDVCERFDVKEACARDYIRWVGTRRTLHTEREAGGIKVWRLQPEDSDHPHRLHRAAGLAFAVRALSELKGAPQYDALVDLAAESRLSLTSEEQVRLERMARSFQVRAAHRSRSPNRQQHLRILLRAIEQRRPCRMEYIRRDGTAKQYTVDPWGLVFFDHRLLFVGGKHVDGLQSTQQRFFEFDGIQAIFVVDGAGRFAEPSDSKTNFPELFRDYIGIYCGLDQPAEDIVLYVRGGHAIALKQRRVHASQQQRDLDDGWTEVRLSAVVCPDLVSFVLSMLPDVRVQAPERLIEQVRAAVDAARA